MTPKMEMARVRTANEVGGEREMIKSGCSASVIIQSGNLYQQNPDIPFTTAHYCRYTPAEQHLNHRCYESNHYGIPGPFERGKLVIRTPGVKSCKQRPVANSKKEQKYAPSASPTIGHTVRQT